MHLRFAVWFRETEDQDTGLALLRWAPTFGYSLHLIVLASIQMQHDPGSAKCPIPLDSLHACFNGHLHQGKQTVAIKHLIPGNPEMKSFT